MAEGEPKLNEEPESDEYAKLGDTADLPVLDPEVERLDKLHREKELKRRRNELKKRMKLASGLDDTITALRECGFESLVKNIIATKKELKQMTKGADPEGLAYTIESVLESKDLFRGEGFDIGEEYLNKKLRHQLTEFIRQEAEYI